MRLLEQRARSAPARRCPTGRARPRPWCGRECGLPARRRPVPASMIARTLMPRDVPQSSIGDDAVLRHVDQTAGQVARVRRLERGVGETLARAVRRVEVLEHREAFLEVGDDRALDDLAGRLRHQAAHAGELAHLRRRTAGAGMRHHVDRVDLRLGALLGRRLHRRDFLHHRFGDLLGALRPGVDDLVVLLALGDQAVVVLLLELLDQLAGVLDDLSSSSAAPPCRPCRTRCRP